ncbi:hypothetical protein TNCV_1718911 [Trichonephila clavipes]|nr:hypothetical protein TNCV_1718911 [Trichonephila clavipes]
MSSFLVLSEGDTRDRWRDGQVYPDVGQGTMAPWARRLGRRKRKRKGEEREEEKEQREEMEKEREEKEKQSGREREEPALYGEKG